MNDLTSPISDLKQKIEKLVTLHGQLKSENDRLQAENTTFKQQLAEQKKEIEALKTNNQELTKNKNEEQNKIITDTKTQISELVQEIDNCITLLK